MSKYHIEVLQIGARNKARGNKKLREQRRVGTRDEQNRGDCVLKIKHSSDYVITTYLLFAATKFRNNPSPLGKLWFFFSHHQ